MSRVVFVRTGYHRRNEFLTRTIGELNEQGFFFKKTPMTAEARKVQIPKMMSVYEEVKKLGLEQYFCKPTLSHSGEIIFPRVLGSNLEEAILESVLNGDDNLSNKYLDKFESLLSKLVVKTKSNLPEDSLIFGDELHKNFSRKRNVYPGVLDVTFDNVMMSQAGLVIIDYEWSLPEPLPTDYLLFRSILWFGLRYAELFKLHSSRLGMTSLSEELVLPDFFFERYKDLENKLGLSLRLERKYFQPYATNVKSFTPIVLHAPEVFVGSDQNGLGGPDLVLTTDLTEDLERTKEENYILELKKLTLRLQRAEFTVARIRNSLSYKLYKLLTFPVRLLQRLFS